MVVEVPVMWMGELLAGLAWKYRAYITSKVCTRFTFSINPIGL